MIRTFCDACEKEIIDRTEIGEFSIQEKTIGWLRHQKQDQVKRMGYIFCISCARKIRDFFQRIKTEEENGGKTK